MAADTPALSLSERLTNHFYDWERRGRGWQVWPEPVDLEPSFKPFWGHFVPESDQDDSRRPTAFSSFFGSLRSILAPTPPPTQAVLLEEESDPSPAPEGSGNIEWQIMLPAESDTSCRLFEAFLLSLSYCRYPIAFEVLGGPSAIRLVLVADEEDASQVEDQLHAHFPEAILNRQPGCLRDALQMTEGNGSLVVDFGLSHEFMLPLATHGDLQADFFVSLIGALSNLRAGELGIFQVLFKPVSHAWSQSIARAVTFPDGSPFFDGAPEFSRGAKEKISRPLYAVVVRIASVGADEDRIWQIARSLTNSLRQFANLEGNELIPLANDGYDDSDHLADLLARQSRRSGMLLNCEELASLIHLPAREVQNAKLVRVSKTTKAVPAAVMGHSLKLGTNLHNGRETEVTLSADQRVRHMHVIGASGTGKSTFLLNLITQDIENGQGVGVLDPHGDLIDQIIERIPESRIKDAVLVDPSDDQFPIGFNILSAHSDLEKTLLASDLVGIFRRFSTSWGDQMGSVLGNAVLAFLESSRSGTLSDLRRFLIEPSFRNEFLTTVQDPHVTYYWRKEFSLLAGSKSQAPLLTRLDTFLRPKPIRYMVTQQQNRLNLADIMDTSKIFLAKLAQGAIGEENAFLLGSLIVSKFHQITLGRQATAEQSRKYFWLYCDEFGGYITPSMAHLLSGARKYRLGLVLAHQSMQQLHDEEVQSALIANAYTCICFRLGDSDAKALCDSFATFEAKDLRNLATGEALAKVGRAEDDFNLTTHMMEEVEPQRAKERKAAILKWTRESYATPRALVEAKLARDMEQEEPAPKRQTTLIPVPSPPSPPPPTAPATNEVLSAAETQSPASEKFEPEPVQPISPTPVVRKLRNLPPVVADMGKGGKEHKYLQQLLAQWAQGMGYRATIEMPAPNGAGSIDVVLEKEGRRIACEISVTSTVEQEVGNLQKCLDAGFAEVFMICAEARTLNGLKKVAEAGMDAKLLEKVKFLAPDDLFSSADLLDGAKQEQTVRGYKVKVHRKVVDDKESADRRRAVGQVMMKGMGKK